MAAEPKLIKHILEKKGTCPSCQSPKQESRLNPIPVYLCGSLIVEEKMLRSWSCREITQLQARIEILEGVCVEAYQMVGQIGAAERILDNLSDAAAGRPLRHESFLPVVDEDFKEIVQLQAKIEELEADLKVEKERVEELKELGKELLDTIVTVNNAIQYIEDKLDESNKDIFLDFHMRVNATFFKDRPALNGGAK